MSIAPGTRRGTAVLLDEAHVVENLGSYLPTALIASLAGVKDASQVRKWARGTLVPTSASTTRLRFALDQAHRIEAAESAKVASAWLTSANEQLDYALPIKAIREDKFKAVADAVTSFIDGYAG